MRTIYRIKDLKTGLWSKGGIYQPTFNKKGKIWTTKSGLKNHLNQHRGRIPDSWVIVEYRLEETEVRQSYALNYRDL